MSTLSGINEAWQNLMDKSDPRVKDWFMMSSFLPTFLIVLGYIFFVKHLGPKLMEERKPFQLREVLVVYNFIQVAISVFIFYKSCTLAWLNNYNWRCEPVDPSPTGTPLLIARTCWYYLLSKYPELLDTVFFVMRKRYDQISTLHVIHHGIMPISVWWGVKFSPGGHGTFFGLLNTFVHIIMYTYYMLAAIGPQMQKHLWWKKYLTQLQLLQFAGIITHSLQLYIKNDCNYPLVYPHALVFHGVMFMCLFGAFYKKSYIHKKD